jgi:hypothetical protein
MIQKVTGALAIVLGLVALWPVYNWMALGGVYPGGDRGMAIVFFDLLTLPLGMMLLVGS